ncbi:phosphohistidine phosphatase SixA [Jannaschia seosinensis]|uniref:Phosphohistidine phosphatase SixA n=1 Tax=Jannaschia seosinensis TaxID=313367 RepID=A0A0M7B7H1_9RHOB|nr:histidine phosphatase family protein [Jannaschia seosinensis]CUH29756.1 phosphohistidine phosphatase SixA [Jannaschia seosinensis]
MKLILLRHAKSDWTDPDQDDHERPLNERGRHAATALGDWLRSRGYLPTHVLCSDATRTRQTLEGLALPETPTEYRADLYLSGAGTILDLAKDSDAECLLIVAHSPGIGQAAGMACVTPPNDPDFGRYPTGACTVIDNGIPGRCLDFTTPRAL